jgi:hypothetical protein
MFSIFKRSVSAQDFATAVWASVRDWPTELSADLRRTFTDCAEVPEEEVFNEMIYFKAFATDYAFWRQLENASQLQKTIRGVFTQHLESFANEHCCSPIPSGDWIGDGLIWMPGDTILAADHRTSLRQRFELYGNSLARRTDRSAGERAAHILAALCGTHDAIFILSAMPFFLATWKSVQEALAGLKIRI